LIKSDHLAPVLVNDEAFELLKLLVEHSVSHACEVAALESSASSKTFINNMKYRMIAQIKTSQVDVDQAVGVVHKLRKHLYAFFAARHVVPL